MTDRAIGILSFCIGEHKSRNGGTRRAATRPAAITGVFSVTEKKKINRKRQWSRLKPSSRGKSLDLRTEEEQGETLHDSHARHSSIHQKRRRRVAAGN